MVCDAKSLGVALKLSYFLYQSQQKLNILLCFYRMSVGKVSSSSEHTFVLVTGVNRY